MATKVVWSNPVVYVNGVDLSASLSKFKIDRKWEDLSDAAAINDTGKRHVKGLQDNAFEGQFMTNFDAAGVNQTIGPIAATAAGTCAIIAWPNGSTTGTANPKYTGNAFIHAWAPLDVSPGQLAVVDFSWPCDGTLTESYT